VSFLQDSYLEGIVISDVEALQIDQLAALFRTFRDREVLGPLDSRPHGVEDFVGNWVSFVRSFQ
jgi:hypothetical protein